MTPRQSSGNGSNKHFSRHYSILIVDDDEELTEMLHSYLEAENFVITVANESVAGLALATSNANFDLILLDVMMPYLTGFEFLKQLRLSNTIPVIMLTARGDDYDRILGLELGADDYLPKPFNHRELLARINAIFRRQEIAVTPIKSQEIQVNGVILHSGRQTVECNEQLVTLTSTEFSILHVLMENAGELITKELISEKVLGRKLMAYDRSIDMHVSNLRKKLAACDNSDKIKTVRGAGYLLRTHS
ncbi:response regulator transcription factor [Alteromonas ponticola]|uniref:Response regulator transcription factor n=1 Tax=Alteromonas ponticola TaxID=2720613 RepID=A0ABX1R0T6_9ALTE|nr:response regulator transcription factor [Alteromonas ponticola]NMH60077.1 response regulator transcription factor [Alteromonas ponticola]